MSLLALQVGDAARTASQNRSSCRSLRVRVETLGQVLPLYEAARDRATRGLLRDLKAALYDALVMVRYCQRAAASPYDYSATKAKIKDVRARIDYCLEALKHVNDLKLLRQNEQLAAAAAAIITAQAPRRLRHR